MLIMFLCGRPSDHVVCAERREFCQGGAGLGLSSGIYKLGDGSGSQEYWSKAIWELRPEPIETLHGQHG